MSAADAVAPAVACSCANWRAPDLFPYPGAPGVARPRNPRLRLSPIWNLPGYGDWARDHGFDGKTWQIELVKAGSSKVEPTEQRVVGEAEERVLEIWPKAPLEPDASYELRRAGGVTRTGPGFPTTRASFTTTARVDDKAPAWAGARAARYLPKGVPTDSSCGVGSPLVEIDVSAPSDEETPPAQIVFAVWVAPAGAAVDYAKPPAAIATHAGGRVHLGRPGYCSEANVKVTNERQRFGLRAVDLAGNMSVASEVALGDPPKDGPSGTSAPSVASGGATAPAATAAPAKASRGCGRAP